MLIALFLFCTYSSHFSFWPWAIFFYSSFDVLALVLSLKFLFFFLWYSRVIFYQRTSFPLAKLDLYCSFKNLHGSKIGLWTWKFLKARISSRWNSRKMLLNKIRWLTFLIIDLEEYYSWKQLGLTGHSQKYRLIVNGVAAWCCNVQWFAMELVSCRKVSFLFNYIVNNKLFLSCSRIS